MSDLKKKLKQLDKNKIRDKWQNIDNKTGLSTREKLEKLVSQNLKREKKVGPETVPAPAVETELDERGYLVREYSYPLETFFGRFPLSEWLKITGKDLALLTGDNDFVDVDPMKMVYFDTETTGLSGGTGTIPFMVGFGFFSESHFLVKIFILTDLAMEEEFLTEVERFLEQGDFSATVTYNGKGFDFPLMETRYILQRKRFPLLKLPHLDFLYPARNLWKYTYESRKLGFLGDRLLNISRDDDIDASQIPMLYFSFLRTSQFHLLEPVVEHNALDLVGLAALVLLGLKYLDDMGNTEEEGEILGSAILFEKYGDHTRSQQLYHWLQQQGQRQDLTEVAVKRMSVLKKKEKLYTEAKELWQVLAEKKDRYASRELSIHYEHREKNFRLALSVVRKTLEESVLTESQEKDFLKRVKRLEKKISSLDEE